MEKIGPGSRGLRVRLLQRRLKGREGVVVRRNGDKWVIVRDGEGQARGWRIDPGPVDGVYGEQTEKAIASFQAMHGLDPTGTAGKRVLRKIDFRRALRQARRRRRQGQFAIIPRERWNPQPPRGTIGSVAEPTSEYFLHCTVGREPGPDASLDEEAEAMRALQGTAFSRGFFDISYSFVQFQSGRVWEGRGWDKAGAHTEGFNSSTYAIAFAIACTPDGKVSDAAIRNAGRLCQLGRRFGAMINAIRVRLHREVAAKSCPGDYVAARRGEIEQVARA